MRAQRVSPRHTWQGGLTTQSGPSFAASSPAVSTRASLLASTAHLPRSVLCSSLLLFFLLSLPESESQPGSGTLGLVEQGDTLVRESLSALRTVMA